MHTYMFQWNGRRKYIDADNVYKALTEFQRRFGFAAEYTENMTILAQYAQTKEWIPITVKNFAV